MEKLISSAQYTTDHLARPLLEALEAREVSMNLSEAVFYYDFPSFRDYEDDAYRPKRNALVSCSWRCGLQLV